MSTVLANPAKMIAHGAPRVIHNDEELAAYTAALFQLTALEKPSASETEAIELLTLLVERYEQKHYPIPAANPVSVVRFLMEQQGLKQRDLVPQFGLRERGFHVPRRTTEADHGAGAKIARPVQAPGGCFHRQEIMGQPLAILGWRTTRRATIKPVQTS